MRCYDEHLEGRMSEDEKDSGSTGQEQPPVTSDQEESPPPFDPDYDLITYIERGQGPRRDKRH